MENSSKIILGLLGAVAAGIAIGMLMAPDKGSELRKKLGEKAGDLASSVGDLVTTAKGKFDEVTGAVGKQAENLAHEAGKRTESLVNEAGRRADRVKESMS